MKALLRILPLCVALAGCSAPFEGIRMRATAPAIDDAWRKIRIAAELDGFSLEEADAGSRSFTTSWRDLRGKERPPGERDTAMTQRVRLTLHLAPRGRMYDVMLMVLLRGRDGGTVSGIPAPPGHPVVVRWRKVLGRLLERESRDED